MRKEQDTWRGGPRQYMLIVGLIEAHHDSDACLEWPYTRNDSGYGIVIYQKTDWRVHRLAYKLIHGRLYRELEVMHSCDNPPCFNPKHLSQGTHIENVHDMWAKGRRGHVNYARGPRGPNLLITGEQHGNAKLTNEIVLVIRKRAEAGELASTLATELGFNHSTIMRVIKRMTWKHVP